MTFSPRTIAPTEAGIDEAVGTLTMPDQNLAAPFQDSQAPGVQTRAGTLALRAVVLIVPLCVTVGLGWLSLDWFVLDGRLRFVELALVGMTGFAFYWVVLSVATAMLGLFWRAKPVAEPLHGMRVAILLPMYGEAAQVTIGNGVELLAGLKAAGRHRFSLHVLSDTRDPVAALLEEAAVSAARRACPALSIQYRRRVLNLDYKSGNIRDWVQAQGQAFDAMLILDADSVMGVRTVVQMTDALAAEPGLGLIQSIPRVGPGHTLWQGMQSFASEVYGVNMGRGFALWTGNEGNFLGHNALVRVPAFAASAGLPHLPGAAPRGGVILSHDFVEAALLRRAGWGVRIMPEAAESFEETPETLVGYVRRDRRWCQGNLQHIRLLRVPGLHPLSRFHLLQGAMAYLSSVWWLILLILWALPGREGLTARLAALPDGPALTQAGIAGVVGVMLIAPKLLGVVGHIRDHGLPLARAPRFAGLVLGEIALSILLAPALMVHQVRAVLRTAGGLDGGWMPHVAGPSNLRTLLRFHALETGLGIALLLLLGMGQMSLWLCPIAVSLCLTVPLAALVQMPRSAFHLRLAARRVA